MSEVKKPGVDYNEIEKNIPAQIDQIRETIKEKHNISIPEKCDKFIARCLRLKDGNVKKATNLVYAFHSVITDISGWNATLDPSAYDEHCYSVDGLFLLVNRDAQGRRIFISRVNRWDPKKISFDEVMLAFWLVAQFGISNFVDIQRIGYVVIWDLGELTLQQAWSVKQRRLLKLHGWVHSGITGRMKNFHCINHPRIVGMIYNGIKPFFTEKIKKRINFHSNFESLHESIDPKILPKFLGGELEMEDCVDRQFMHDVVHSGEFFKDMATTKFPSA